MRGGGAGDGGAVGKSTQSALAPERFLDSQTGLALLIRRARDVARTTRHARHVTHDTTRQRKFPVGDTFGITPPTSDLRLPESRQHVALPSS